MQLRDYQVKAIDDARSAAARLATTPYRKNIVLVAPTGAGKTVIAAQLARSAVAKGRRVLFLAHRRELVKQCENKLLQFGVDNGVIMSGEFLQMEYEVQVASIDTLRARAMSNNRMPMPPADLVIIDEAHRSLAPTYMKLIEHYADAVVIGLTATPIRGDGKGLGHVYEEMVQCPTVGELTELGHLVPARYFAPTIPDLTGIKVVRGDYDAKQLEEAMNQRQPVGDIIENWGRIAPDRPTIVFASGVKHSIHLRDEFEKVGVRAVHVDGEMTRVERDAAIGGLLDGTYQVVTNCMVLTEGFDMPELSCCVLARPTKNLGLYLQMAGRVLRPSEGKEDTVIIDHSGNVYAHGFVADDHGWSLDVGAPMRSAEERRREFKESKPITCVKCSNVYTGQRACPSCGHVPQVYGKSVETKHAVLTEVEGRKTAKKKVYEAGEKQLWYSMLLSHAQKKGKSKGWLAHTYKAKFGVWPRGMDDIATEPNIEVQGFIRSRAIAWAKKREKEKQVEARAN